MFERYFVRERQPLIVTYSIAHLNPEHIGRMDSFDIGHVSYFS